MLQHVKLRSPYSLIQEDLLTQPFWLLVTCFLLNKSSRAVAQDVLRDLMSRWPTPSALSAAHEEDVSAIVKRLGFVKRRTAFITKLAKAASRGKDLLSQAGVGEYARRSHQIFYEGVLGDEEPQDGPLKRYWRWRAVND